MPDYDRITLGRQAKELGFVRDTFEKVCRLIDILGFIENDTLLFDCLALKGGTAVNLTIFDLPRLSVDIDLDFVGGSDRGTMLDMRKRVTDRIEKYMAAAEYNLSTKSKYHYALDSFVYEYVNAGGMKDNIKIEINYMLRCHILAPSVRKIDLPWMEQEISILCVAPVEIFASKIVALLSRTAPRDLYDVYNLQRYKLFDEGEEDLLRKCTVFYSAIAREKAPDEFNFEPINNLEPRRIKTELMPVLRNGENFDLKKAQEEIIEYLSGILIPTEEEREFWHDFNQNTYRPEKIFSSEEILDRIRKHPMAIWKCEDNQDTKK